MSNQAERIIKLLNLVPLPGEGGYFRETYRSRESAPVGPLLPGTKRAEPDPGSSPGGEAGALSTAIYYLITDQSWSALHRIPSDEIFHFYGGSPATMLQICEEKGQSRVITLGNNLEQGHEPQVLVPKGVWQGTRLIGSTHTKAGGHSKPSGQWTLLGTTVAPGFQFPHLEMAGADTIKRLLRDFPRHRELIRLLEPDCH